VRVFGVAVVGEDQGRVLVAEAADGDLAQRMRAAADGHVLFVDFGLGVGATAFQGDLRPRAVGQRLQLGGQLRVAGAQRDERQFGGV
jgi:hypothetical protein